jgi:hypothetical protein
VRRLGWLLIGIGLGALLGYSAATVVVATITYKVDVPHGCDDGSDLRGIRDGQPYTINVNTLEWVRCSWPDDG